MPNTVPVYKLQRRIPPGDVIDRAFGSKEEAESYAARIFLLHPNGNWRDIFEIVKTTNK